MASEDGIFVRGDAYGEMIFLAGGAMCIRKRHWTSATTEPEQRDQAREDDAA